MNLPEFAQLAVLWSNPRQKCCTERIPIGSLPSASERMRGSFLRPPTPELPNPADILHFLAHRFKRLEYPLTGVASANAVAISRSLCKSRRSSRDRRVFRPSPRVAQTCQGRFQASDYPYRSRAFDTASETPLRITRGRSRLRALYTRFACRREPSRNTLRLPNAHAQWLQLETAEQPPARQPAMIDQL